MFEPDSVLLEYDGAESSYSEGFLKAQAASPKILFTFHATKISSLCFCWIRRITIYLLVLISLSRPPDLDALKDKQGDGLTFCSTTLRERDRTLRTHMLP